MIRKGTLYFTLLIISLVISCTEGNSDITTERLEYSEYLRFAKEDDNIRIVEIVNPWDTSRILHRYILIPKDYAKQADDGHSKLPEGTIVRTPIDKVVVYSSVHASIIEELGAAESIVGVCEPEYIVSSAVRKRIKEGKIIDCGNTVSPNIERIIQSGAQIIIASPFENSSYGAVEKIGLPIIEGADYMENTPVGRLAWIRFFGMLLECEHKADSIFLATSESYNILRSKVAVHLEKDDVQRPTLIAERRYGSSWDVPNSESYMVRMYEDAGAKYLFDYLPGTGSTNMSFEKVFHEGAKADYWIFKYWKESEEPMTLCDLEAEYALYNRFDAFKNGRIYACNSALTSYYDDIMLHPDAVLKDFIAIFHPQVLEEDGIISGGYTPKYFLPLGRCR